MGGSDVGERRLSTARPVTALWGAYRDHCRANGIEPSLTFLGHGIGRTIHEEPYLTETREVTLQANMTHTMEPLYMLPGRMGFHVEDMYRITDSGHVKITGGLVPNDDLIEVHS